MFVFIIVACGILACIWLLCSLKSASDADDQMDELTEGRNKEGDI